MKNRLTQPMRQVLQNLINGKPVGNGLTTSNMRDVVIATVTGTLRKRGYISMRPDTTFVITPQGRAALTDTTTKAN